MPRKASKMIHWRGQMVAAEHGVLSARDLYRRLKPLGLRLSESQLARLYRGQPKRMNQDVLALFCQAFDVTPNDLQVLIDRPRPTEKVVSIRPPVHPATDAASLIGPPVPPLPEGRWRS